MIFFDIDDTLIDSESAHRTAIIKLCDKYNIQKRNPGRISDIWLAITGKYLNQFSEKKISLNEQRTYRIRDFWNFIGMKISGDEALDIYKDYHNYFLYSCLPFADTENCLRRMKDHKLGIISNGIFSDQIVKLQINNLENFFNVIVVSEIAESNKPDKEIFNYAAKRASVDLPDCIYIGNSYAVDYLGALNAGMKPVLLDRKYVYTTIGCQKIHSLDELFQYL